MFRFADNFILVTARKELLLSFICTLFFRRCLIIAMVFVTGLCTCVKAQWLTIHPNMQASSVQWEKFGDAQQFEEKTDQLIFTSNGSMQNTHLDFQISLKAQTPYLLEVRFSNLGKNLKPAVRIARNNWSTITTINNDDTPLTSLASTVFTVEKDMQVRVQFFGNRQTDKQFAKPSGQVVFEQFYLRPADATDLDKLLSAQIQIHPDQPIANTSKLFAGTNTLYWHENQQAMQSKDYTNHLKNMGVSLLRFPAGEAADDYDWRSAKSNVPFTANITACDPEVSIDQVTQFDQYMTWVKQLGATPILVVNLESSLACDNIDQGIQLACDWVRYSNKTQGYNVRYWEIGNESYLSGGCLPLTASQYAKAFVRFAKAMKQVDPTIQIGANGPNRINAHGAMDTLPKDLLIHYQNLPMDQRKDRFFKDNYFKQKIQFPAPSKAWWPTVCHLAGQEIDFVTIHHYANIHERSSMQTLGTAPMLMQSVFTELSNYLSKTLNRPIPLALTEWNISRSVKNLSPYEAALTNVELALNAINAGVQMGCFWPMRWPTGQFDQLAMFEMDYQPRPVYWMLKLVFNQLGDQVLSCQTQGSHELFVTATKDLKKKKIYCFIINRSGLPFIQTRLPDLQSDLPTAICLTEQACEQPHALAITTKNEQYKIQLPPRSLTVITYSNVPAHK